MKVDIMIASFKDNNSRMIPSLIKWWTKSKYYHTEISVNGRWVASTAEDGVTVSNGPNYRDPYDEHHISVDLTGAQLDKLNKWITAREYGQYDYLGIGLSQIIPLRVDSSSRWFCSEIATKVLQLALVKEVYDVTPNMVSPGHLAKLFGVE